MTDSPARPDHEITELLVACSKGDSEAMDRLIPLVYDDLRAIARHRLRSEQAGHTLSTTALVHEAYLKLVDQSAATWTDRAHFFAVSATVIRNLLIDYARERLAAKRGGGVVHLPIEADAPGRAPRTIELLALDEALAALGRREARLERVVEYRFFAGMTLEETAESLGVSLSTVRRDWLRARAYLYRELI